MVDFGGLGFHAGMMAEIILVKKSLGHWGELKHALHLLEEVEMLLLTQLHDPSNSGGN